MKRNSQKPIALWRSQLKRRQPGAPPDPQAPLPPARAGPPDDETGQRRHAEDGAADAVPVPARTIEQQLVVQAREPEHEVFALGHRVAEVLTGVGIEEPLFLFGAALDPDFDRRVAPCDAIPDPRDRPSGICALRLLPQLLGRQTRGLRIERRAGRGEEPIQLVAIDQRAPRHAQHHDVQPERQPGPQMNLKKCPAQPHPLRLSHPPLPHLNSQRPGTNAQLLPSSQRQGDCT